MADPDSIRLSGALRNFNHAEFGAPAGAQKSNMEIMVIKRQKKEKPSATWPSFIAPILALDPKVTKFCHYCFLVTVNAVTFTTV